MLKRNIEEYRIVSAEHGCCFEARVERKQEFSWVVVAEFENETDARFFLVKLQEKEVISTYIENSTLFSHE